MYNEIEDILSGKVTSKWSQEEIKEVWHLVYFKTKRDVNKREVAKLCLAIRNAANLLRHPDPDDNCPAMWVSIFLFTSFKRLPLFINHKDDRVKKVTLWRLGKGK